MKKIVMSLLILATILSSFAAFADRDNDRPVIRISVGDSNVTQLRIQRLEAAVRDLQDIVYDLQDDRRDRGYTEYVCALKTNFEGTFIGKGSSKIEAEASAIASCRRNRASFCESTRITCEKTKTRR